LFLVLLPFAVRSTPAGDQSLNRSKKVSLYTGSFVYHAYAPHDDFTQYFDNRFLAVEARLGGSAVDGLTVGTFVNSNGDRCLLLGVQKNWIPISRRTTFEGVYAYAGEFFFDTFANCGAKGYYHDFEKATGIGFAPYLYHGVEYDLTSYVSMEGGIILPGIVVLTVQWHF